MALKLNITGENGASLGTYHRIAEEIRDYTRGQISYIIDHYADQSYRDKEKEQQLKLENMLKRHEKLSKKAELTKEEKIELLGLNPQHIMATEIIRTSLASTKYGLYYSDDLCTREQTYNALCKLEPFKGAVKI